MPLLPNTLSGLQTIVGPENVLTEKEDLIPYSIDGTAAENSGGLRGLKYGITRNYVMGLEVVLPDGEVLSTGNKCVKDVAGYSLKDLFIGSEGTLGVITKILLKLIPKPAAKCTL